MADCLITSGRSLSCKDAVGGFKAVYFANYDDYGFLATANLITDLGSLAAVYKYELKGTGNTFQQDITTSRDNGTTFFSQVLNISLPKIDADTANEVKLMAYGRPVIFVEDNMGNVFIVGKENGADLTAGTLATGGNMGDFNGFTATFTGQEKDSVAFLSPTSITSLKALVVE